MLTVHFGSDMHHRLGVLSGASLSVPLCVSNQSLVTICLRWIRFRINNLRNNSQSDWSFNWPLCSFAPNGKSEKCFFSLHLRIFENFVEWFSTFFGLQVCLVTIFSNKSRSVNIFPTRGLVLTPSACPFSLSIGFASCSQHARSVLNFSVASSSWSPVGLTRYSWLTS